MDRQIAALELFRRCYGIGANHEQHPILWEACLNLVDEQISYEEFLAVDEGGEA